MPNHVIHEVSFSGDEKRIKELLKFVNGGVDDDGDEIPFDFEKIIPMPESLHIDSGSRVDQAIAVLTDDEKELRTMLTYTWWIKEHGYKTTEDVKLHLLRNLTEEDLEMGRKAIHNMKEYGHKDWYSWSKANWGTKWNCYEVSINENNVISFQTAWSTPVPIFAKLGEIFPDVGIIVKFADEDIGANCGTYIVEGNKFIECPNENPTQFANELWGYDVGVEDETDPTDPYSDFNNAVDNLLDEGKL